jgi:ABC-type amino acid transport substrate-binding protein
MSPWKRAACVLACLWLSAGFAHAGSRDLVIGVEELDYYPAYSWRNGEYVGAARDIFDAFAKARGYRFTYRAMPIKRLYVELLSDGIDFKFPDNPEWNSEAKVGKDLVYSNPVIAYVDGVSVRAENVGKGPDSIRTLGTVAGFTPFSWLGRIRAGQVQLRENPRMDQLLKQVVLDRVDGAYASVAVMNYYLDHMLGMPGALVFDPALPHSRDHYRLSTVRHPEVVAEFNAWIAANQALVAAIKERTGAEKGVR